MARRNTVHIHFPLFLRHVAVFLLTNTLLTFLFLSEDLSSLRSIAAILGGISFGIFIFLLLCSIIYKRYVSNDERRDSCAPTNPGENDYLDAVQAAAPPSYQTG